MQFVVYHRSFLWYCTRPVPKRWREGINRQLVRRLPDRRYLEREILPWLACESGLQPHILSIGCLSHTVHYEAMLKRRGARYSTVDINPAASPYGARYHVVKNVTDLVPSDFPASVDGVLFNGVIGWGLDEPQDIEDAFAALAVLLRRGSLLVVGWNTDRSADPIAAIQNATALFSVCPAPTGEDRVTFPGSTHVYDFLRRR